MNSSVWSSPYYSSVETSNASFLRRLDMPLMARSAVERTLWLFFALPVEALLMWACFAMGATFKALQSGIVFSIPRCAPHEGKQVQVACELIGRNVVVARP